ncbi:MAG TPA: hypothetical protein VGB17_17965 [Pyrinomonadaceae bacterium]
MAIIASMLAVLVTFALLSIARAQQTMALNNTAREFTSYVEKVRSDSIRRHATNTAAMASVTINSNTSYTVQFDADRNGTLDPGRTITFAPESGLTFSGVTVPTTIRFDYRGRTVDDTGAVATLASFRLANPQLPSPYPLLSISSAGDAGVDNSASYTTVTPSTVSTSANVNPETSLP